MVTLLELVGHMKDINSYKPTRFISYGGHSLVVEVAHPDKPKPLAMKIIEVGDSLAKSVSIHEQPIWRASSQEQPIQSYSSQEQLTKVHGSKEHSRTQMVVNERRILKILGNHPNIASLECDGEIAVKIRQRSGEEEDVTLLYNIYSYVNALDTDELVSGQLAIPAIVDIVLGVANAGAYIHSKQVIHKDIKPSNMLVDRDTYKPRLTDFGIAFYIHDGKEAEICGTPGYMSPEQARDESLDYRSDVFSLGASLFEMLTGVLAVIEGRDQVETAINTVDRRIRAYGYPFWRKRRDAPRKLVRLLREMIEFDVENRPDMEEVVDRLGAIKKKL